MTRFGDLPEVYFASDTKGIGKEGYCLADEANRNASSTTISHSAPKLETTGEHGAFNLFLLVVGIPCSSAPKT
jgi:hypothetical protein